MDGTEPPHPLPSAPSPPSLSGGCRGISFYYFVLLSLWRRGQFLLHTDRPDLKNMVQAQKKKYQVGTWRAPKPTEQITPRMFTPWGDPQGSSNLRQQSHFLKKRKASSKFLLIWVIFPCLGAARPIICLNEELVIKNLLLFWSLALRLRTEQYKYIYISGLGQCVSNMLLMAIPSICQSVSIILLIFQVWEWPACDKDILTASEEGQVELHFFLLLLPHFHFNHKFSHLSPVLCWEANTGAFFQTDGGQRWVGTSQAISSCLHCTWLTPRPPQWFGLCPFLPSLEYTL